MTLKWAIYVRTSTKDKQDPQMQKVPLVEYATRCGYEYEIFIEQESSRKTRPVKETLLQNLRKRQYAGVIVWKLDRWGRSTAELVTELNELHDKGLKFISLQDNIDMSTASGRAFVGFLAVFAEFERDLTRERVLEGLENAKRNGKKLGRPTGSTDKKVRNKSGYHLRYAKKRVQP